MCERRNQSASKVEHFNIKTNLVCIVAAGEISTAEKNIGVFSISPET
jgi:hypothetical protein